MDFDLTGYRFVPAPCGTRKFRQKVYLKRKLLGVIYDQKAEFSYTKPQWVNKYYATTAEVAKQATAKLGSTRYKPVPGASSCKSLEEAFVKLVMYHMNKKGIGND